MGSVPLIKTKGLLTSGKIIVIIDIRKGLLPPAKLKNSRLCGNGLQTSQGS